MSWDDAKSYGLLAPARQNLLRWSIGRLWPNSNRQWKTVPGTTKKRVNAVRQSIVATGLGHQNTISSLAIREIPVCFDSYRSVGYQITRSDFAGMCDKKNNEFFVD